MKAQRNLQSKGSRSAAQEEHEEHLTDALSMSAQTSEKEDTTMTSMQAGRHMMIERMDVRCKEMLDIRKSRAQEQPEKASGRKRAARRL